MGLEYEERQFGCRRGFGKKKMGKSVCLLEGTAFQSLE